MGIFLDVQKAFDCVNHELLLKKLENSGIRGVSNNLFKSFLSGRTQRVKCYEYSSEDLNVTCGVPQGTVLGLSPDDGCGYLEDEGGICFQDMLLIL
ncbi:Reverse transcriptase domain-containing protein, partial [Aphis craccivora]